MGEKIYSRASFNRKRLSALLGAISADVPHDDVSMRLAGDTIPIDHVSAALASSDVEILPLTLRFTVVGDTTLRISISASWTLLIVNVACADEEAEKRLHSLISDTLGLQKATDEDWRGVASLGNINDVVWSIHDKVVELQRSLAATSSSRSRRLRCFVSFRFDDHSKALAFELRELLDLADVDFVSGMGFEPRSVSEKVLDRLMGELDLFLIIHASPTDSAWLNQEVGVARARKLPIIVLREGDTKFDPGMLGDTEFISFPANEISRSYVAVLQAIKFLREMKVGA